MNPTRVDTSMFFRFLKYLISLMEK
jgi:hypothetical protein